MKKLKLKLDDTKVMLTKEQMKKISGGYGEDFCDPHTCPPGSVLYVCGPPSWNAKNEGCATVYYYQCLHYPARVGGCSVY